MCQQIFFIILATAISGMPTPEIPFLLGQLKRTILPQERYGDSLSVGELDTQPSNWDGALFHWTIAATAKSLSPVPRCQVMLWCAVGVLLKNQRYEMKYLIILYYLTWYHAKPFLPDFERRGNLSHEKPEP